MKNKDYKMSKLKHEVFQNRGKDYIIRKLTQEEAEYLSQFAHVEPYLYEVKPYFAPSFSPKGKVAIIKDLYFDCWRKHKRSVIRRLRKKEMKVIKELGFPVRPYKYKIWLNAL